MKIIVPVGDDKQTIFKRTGRAPFFNIYEDDTLLESLENSHASHHDGDGHGEGHGHDHSHEHLDDHEHLNEHKKDVEMLRGCDVILAQAVGEHMAEALKSVGINIIKLRAEDGATADEVVVKFLNNSLKKQQKSDAKPKLESKRLIFPTNENMGYLSKRGAHFGKAKFYTIITLTDGVMADVEVVENQGHNAGACGNAVSNIMALNPDALIVGGIGGSPAQGFANAGLDVYFDGESENVKESIDKFVANKLEKVNGGTCSTH